MASVGAETTHNSITLYLYGLDKSWTLGTRTVYWYLGSANGDIPTDTAYSKRLSSNLANGISEGGRRTFTSLESNTTYGFYCKVVFNSQILFESSGTVRTDVSEDGEEETQTWLTSSLGTHSLITDYVEVPFTMKEYTLHRAIVSFANSGTAIFYTTGDTVDTYGYLSTSTSFDSTTGVLDDPLAEADRYEDSFDGDDGLNFSISYPVEKGKMYRIWVRSYSGNETGNVTLHIIPPDGSPTATVEKWDWFSSNGTADEEQTYDALYAIENHGITRNFSYKVWNDMVDKVKEIMDEIGVLWDYTDYGTYENTKMSGPEETLTAVMFNALRNNIEIVGFHHLSLAKIPSGTTSGNIPHPANQGDIVYGHYFTTLTEYMNDCIDNLP